MGPIMDVGVSPGVLFRVAAIGYFDSGGAMVG